LRLIIQHLNAARNSKSCHSVNWFQLRSDHMQARIRQQVRNHLHLHQLQQMFQQQGWDQLHSSQLQVWIQQQVEQAAIQPAASGDWQQAWNQLHSSQLQARVRQQAWCQTHSNRLRVRIQHQALQVRIRQQAWNYFSRAAQSHERTLGLAITADVRRAITDALRSIGRGQGGTARKEAFPMEDLAKVNRSFVQTSAVLTSTTSPTHMAILGCWFMTRDIELQPALARHIIMYETARTITWYLPSQKNDVKAVGWARTHGCCCTHSRSHICRRTCTASTRTLRRTIPRRNLSTPILPDAMGRYLSKDSVIQTLRTEAAMTGARTTTPNPDGSTRQRFCGHVLRVAGAQGFARAN
jgi:hypothetical protein